MRKFFALLVLSVLPSTALAHKDRVLPIQSDGTLAAIPSHYGPVKVEIKRSKDDAKEVTGVVVSSPRFRTSLNQCVIRKLDNVIQVSASGSWYHNLNDQPPYFTLSFYSSRNDPRGENNEYYSVTFSLLDGQVLSGFRSRVNIFGDWRGRYIYPADRCSHWRWAGMWPNNSFKPTPLRGAA
jgi:hypothetical protein